MAISRDRILQELNRLAGPRSVISEAEATNPTNYDFLAGASFGKNQSSSGDPWWMGALHGIGGIGTIIPNQLAKWTDGDLSWKDIPLADSLAQFGRGQWDSWSNGKLNWGDVPLFGGLTRMSEDADRTSNILDNLGWDTDENSSRLNQIAHGTVGLIGDIALDPLTYLTFGGTSAAKAGQKAALKAAEELASEAGVKLGRNFLDKLPGQVADQTIARNAGKGLNELVLDRLAGQTYNAVRKQLDALAKPARESAQNALINFDVPFTKITKQFGSKPDFLKIRDATAGIHGAAGVMDALAKIGLEGEDASKYLKQAYKVDSAEQMTSQMIDHLSETLGKYRAPRNLPDMVRSSRTTSDIPIDESVFQRGGIENLFDGPIPSGVANTVDELGTGNWVGNLQKALSESDSFRPRQEPRNIVDGEVILDDVITPREFNPDVLGNLLKVTDDFVQDSGGRSKLGEKLFGKTFNPRTFGSADRLVNEAANDLRDAETKIYGNMQWAERELKDVMKGAKGLSESELKIIPYILENHAPKSMSSMFDVERVGNNNKITYKGPNADKINALAEKLKGVFGQIADKEVRAGALDSLRTNYFPHVLKKTPEEILEIQKKFADDEDLMKLVGRSAANGFNQERKSFQTLAQADNYLAKLQKEIKASASDPEKLARLQEKSDIIKNLFDRNPIDVLAKRYYKSIRSTSMKELFDQFKSKGLLKVGKESNVTDVNVRFGLEKLDPKKAKALGLPSDTDVYMHPEVLQGMEKMQNVFSDAGVQKWFDNLNAAVNIWKTGVTTLVPSHYWGNFVGNMFNNMLAGVGTKGYKDAMKLITKVSSGKLTDHEKKLVQQMVDHGVIGSGYAAEFTKLANKGFNNQGTKLEKAAEWVTDKAGKTWIKKGGDFIDNYTRMAHFLDVKSKTGSTKKAAESVRKYLFNYSEMTNADKAIRIVVPFWNWTKRNVPLQLEKLLLEPRYASGYLRLKEQMQGDVDPESLPKWAREAYLRVGENSYFNPRLPISDLNMLSGGPLEVTREALGMLNPFIKLPFEVSLNKQLFNGKPIDWKAAPGEFPSYGAVAPYVAKQLSGIGGKLTDLASGDLDLFDFLFGKTVNMEE